MGRIRKKKRYIRPERIKRNRWHTVDKSTMAFYNSKSWRKLREVKLSMNPFCEQCEALGLLEVGKYVDHIEPLLDAKDKALRLDNLQTLCKSCNASKTSGQANKSKRDENR